MKDKTHSDHSQPRSVYERMIGVFFDFYPVEDLTEIIHDTFLGYGTAAHEFFRNREEVAAMARLQADQLREQPFDITRKPIAEKLLADGTVCLIVEEMDLFMIALEHRLALRLTTLLELTDGHWRVTHFHGSTPDSDIAEEEAFPMEGLRRKNEELEAKIRERTRELEISLEQLKAAQAQLIHAEKMASLGELTAGIAHEIQNPLNFVNNFSEVSTELLQELTEEIQKGDWDEVKTLAEDLTQNLEKIVHHGKRADAIVKGMLQHSRSSDGQKEPTDLNALADEYLRLAYHGLRARDKGFNASMVTEFDPALPRVEVVPQDIGRVLLNLLTNAFHAVSEQKKAAPAGYEPTVTVRTRQTGKGVEIHVADNGNGIPESIKEKIFQPFFTTKPAGQGTGLGLSLSYDIINKGHGGDLKMETAEGKGTVFEIVLPLKKEGA